MSPMNRQQSAVCDLLDVSAPPSHRRTLRLGMMHYHLKAGGVVSVMRDIARALIIHSKYDSLRIDIFASMWETPKAEKTFSPPGIVSPTGIDNERAQVRMNDIPPLAYRSEPYPDGASFLKASNELAAQILERIDVRGVNSDAPYILHAHNISLGKNPTATMAFNRIAEIAAERALPVWLINHVHDFTENNRPDQLRAFFHCTGRRDDAFARSFMYPARPNIIYLTINSADIENLRAIGIPENRIFLMPDPIDATQFTQKPLWEMSREQLAAMGLLPADYKSQIKKRLANYASSTGQVFDASLPILLSPVKVMRRKNNIESLLLLMLFKSLGRSYQLLITLDANSPPDIAYSRKLKSYAAARKMPVLTGLGRELISSTGKRSVKNAEVRRFAMCDLHQLSDALVITSVVEGFGLAYHEGWLSQRLVVGRRIPEIVCDFERNGINFSHMYERLAVSLADIPNLQTRLLEAYRDKVVKIPAVRNGGLELPESAVEDIVRQKFFRFSGEDCVDFADLDVEMQLELLDKVAIDHAFAARMIDRNPVIGDMFQLLEEGAAGMVENNRAVVRSKYSLEAAARRLETLFALGDSLYGQKSEPVSLTHERHAAIIERYHKPENMRLIF